jgi:hypothetical protein
LKQNSPSAHWPSPQPAQVPQSLSQVEQISLGSQVESRLHEHQQSRAQLVQVSEGSQTPLPHQAAHGPQSTAQSQQPSIG